MQDGLTALLVASRCGHADVVHVLIEANVDTNQSTKVNCVQVHCSLGITYIILLYACFIFDTLCVNAESMKFVGDTVLYSYILQDGWTSLLFASLYGHADVVHVLIEVNVDINQKTEVDYV